MWDVVQLVFDYIRLLKAPGGVSKKVRPPVFDRV